MLSQSPNPRVFANAPRPALVRWHADEAVCRKIERFGVYWRALATVAGGVPTRRDFDPATVPSLLPNLLLIEARSDAGCNRVRLAGTCVVAAMGSEITGYDLQNLPREDGARAIAAGVELCLAQQRPIPGEFTLVAESKRAIAGFRFLAAPLAATRAAPAMALVLAVFVAFDGSEVAPQWLGMPTVL